MKIVGLLGPAAQDSFGQVSQTRIEQTGDLLRHLQKLQGSGETQGEITYVSLAGKRYRTTFTMNHALDAESFVRFGSVKAV